MKDWSETLQVALGALTDRAGQYLPSLLAAAAFALAGVVAATVLRSWTSSLLGRLGWFGYERNVETALRRVGVVRPVSEILAGIVFWVVLLFFLTAATETLGLPVLAAWVRGVSEYLPRILMALLLLLVGLLGGGLARDAITTAVAAAGAGYGELLGRIAQVAIVSIAIVTAVDQVGIDSQFLRSMVTVVAGAVIGAAALAFGLGARGEVANIIASHYVRQSYRLGHVVRVGDVEGAIVEFTATAVILDGEHGRVRVPASEFSRTVSVLRTTGGAS